jgi:hypothetical protein
MTEPTKTPHYPTRNVVQLKNLQAASRQLQVFELDAEQGLYVVQSASEPGSFYEVSVQPEAMTGQCSCSWARYGGINCKHVLAALRFAHAGKGTLSFWPSQAAAQRQHRRTLQGQQLYATLRPRQRR